MIKLQKRRAKQWFLIDGMRGEGQLVSEQKKVCILIVMVVKQICL